MTIAALFAAAAFFDSWVLGGSPPERGGYVRIISHHATSHHITTAGGEGGWAGEGAAVLSGLYIYIYVYIYIVYVFVYSSISIFSHTHAHDPLRGRWKLLRMNLACLNDFKADGGGLCARGLCAGGRGRDPSAPYYKQVGRQVDQIV